MAKFALLHADSGQVLEIGVDEVQHVTDSTGTPLWRLKTNGNTVGELDMQTIGGWIAFSALPNLDLNDDAQIRKDNK